MFACRPRRLPLLIAGWETVDSFGFQYQYLSTVTDGSGMTQPVFVLRAPAYGHREHDNGLVQPVMFGDDASVRGSLLRFAEWKRGLHEFIAYRRSVGSESAQAQGGAADANARMSASRGLWTMFPGDNAMTR